MGVLQQSSSYQYEWNIFSIRFTADGKASEATIRKEQRNPPNNSSNLNSIHLKYTKMEIFVEGKVKKCFKYKSFFENFNYMK